MLALPLIITVDLVILLGSFYLFQLYPDYMIMPRHAWYALLMYYFISLLLLKPVSHKRFARIEEVASRAFETMVFFFVALSINTFADDETYVNYPRFAVFAIGVTFLFFCGRACSRSIIKTARRNGRNSRKVVFVGAGVNLAYLYDCLSKFMGKGFVFLGYFNDHVSTHLHEDAILLGDIGDVVPWLEENKPNILYCNLPSSRYEDILKIIKCCDDNFIKFYSVPNVRNYVHRVMYMKKIDDMPVLALNKDPLEETVNRFVKRTFDIIFSGLFLITCFWWIYIIVAVITKLTMPGPVFFVQKRNGLRAKEFNMIKFRSMKVNKEANIVQATKDDTRITRWGEILRKTSIDELPQFINVFIGDMSVVGPRPHMVKQTQEYSALISKYMMRHWIKPGITGWAQVSGARGETEELWQMEDRVQKDIWYIDHWSVWLDLRIIFKTIWNIFRGDEQAY